jgi:hypothetical protein
MAETKLPKFNSAIANLLDWPSAIKMKFPQVGMRFYPLRADIVRLQEVCDTYLNFKDDKDDQPPVCFKPGGPFVLMQTVNYDKLEIEKIGWLRQHEAIFSIPIEWYEKKGESWVFKDWGMTYPFLYLDHPISIWMGREMYGWPKVPVRVPRRFPLRNPPDPEGRVAFDLATHSRYRSDQPEPFRPFIEILQEADGLAAAPWSAGDLYNMVPRAITGGLRAATTIVESFADFFGRKPAGTQAEPYAAMLGSGYSYISKWLPEFWTMMVPGMSREKGKFTASPFMKNNIVLKQFRDAHEINSACYQALVESQISIDELIDAGLLFNPLSGDASGGVTIRLHHYKTQPIVETLGLEVSKISHENGINVSSLKPFCPFWWSLNLSYGNAHTICWRSRTTKFAAPGDEGQTAQHKNDYVKLGSGALEEVAGVEKFPKFLMRVLPVKADLNELTKLCKELFEGVPYTVEPAAPYVLIIADQFGDMTSDADPRRGWADSELSFAIIAKCRDQKAGSVERHMILPLINFAGSEWDAISQREVNGRFTLASDFVAPSQHGMQQLSPTKPDPLRKLFSLRTSICPTLDEDEQTRLWTLVELAEDTAAASQGKPAQESLEQWLKDLRLDSIKAHKRLQSLALKQFRDASLPDYACYQALVQVERQFPKKLEVESIREHLQVTIYEFESMELVKKFGLQGGTKGTDHQGRQYTMFRPEKPFWVGGEMEQGLGVNLYWRAGGMDWQQD